MKKLIEDVIQRLVSTQTKVRYIDEDWGQLDLYSPSPPAKWPCILVEAGDITWENEGELVQIGRARVTVRIADVKLSNSNPKAPATQRAKAAGILDILNEIYQALHGWTGDSMNGPMVRSATRRMKRDDGIREFLEVYDVQVVDNNARKHYDTFHVGPGDITINVSAKTVKAADPPFLPPNP